MSNDKEQKTTQPALRFSPTQADILAVLANGLPHTKEELFAITGEKDRSNSVKVHISNVRKQLRQIGQDIICEFFGYPPKVHYRWVVLLDKDEALELIDNGDYTAQRAADRVEARRRLVK